MLEPVLHEMSHGCGYVRAHDLFPLSDLLHVHDLAERKSNLRPCWMPLPQEDAHLPWQKLCPEKPLQRVELVPDCSLLAFWQPGLQPVLLSCPQPGHVGVEQFHEALMVQQLEMILLVELEAAGSSCASPMQHDLAQ